MRPCACPCHTLPCAGPARLQRLPPALWGLPGLTSLLLNDVGLGMLPRPPNAPPSTHGVYRLPNELRQLAPTLRELALTQHLCAPEELGVLSAVSGGWLFAQAAVQAQREWGAFVCLVCN